MPTLVYSDVDGVDRSYELDLDPVQVGRSLECQIRSDDPRVSRQHARFLLRDGMVWVEDLGSSNGVYVGHQRVQRAAVPIGELVVVGSLLFQLVTDAGPEPPSVGVHTTLAQWLTLERKARLSLLQERDAFAAQVNELLAMRADIAEHQRERDQAIARTSELEHLLAVAHNELGAARTYGPAHDVTILRGELQAARDQVRVLEGELADRSEWSMSVNREEVKLVDELDRLRGHLGEVEAAYAMAVHSGDLARTEADAQRQRHEALQHESARLRSQIDELTADRHRILAEVEAQAAVLAASQLAEAEHKIYQLENQVSQLQSQGTASLESQLSDAFARIAKADRRASTAEEEAVISSVRLQGLQRSIEELRDQLEAQQQAATAALAQVSSLQLQLDEAIAKILTLEAEATYLRDANLQIAVLQALLAEASERAAAAEERTADAQERATGSSAEIEEAEARAASAERRAVEAEEAVAAAEARRTAAEARAYESHHRAGAMELTLRQIEEQRRSETGALSRLEEAIDSLRANLRAIRDEIATMPATTSTELVADTASQACADLDQARAALRAALTPRSET